MTRRGFGCTVAVALGVSRLAGQAVAPPAEPMDIEEFSRRFTEPMAMYWVLLAEREILEHWDKFTLEWGKEKCAMSGPSDTESHLS